MISLRERPVVFLHIRICQSENKTTTVINENCIGRCQKEKKYQTMTRLCTYEEVGRKKENPKEWRQITLFESVYQAQPEHDGGEKHQVGCGREGGEMRQKKRGRR